MLGTVQPLPVDSLRHAFVEALRAGERSFVVRAPTGSGKSTRVPQFLLDSLDPSSGEILMLEPRRVAARALARQIARERGARVGGEIGYQVRFDNQSGPSTRLRILTEGLLVRRFMSAPRLPGVAALVFDEFHERSLYNDTALALARQLQQSHRPELILVLMSATLEGASLAEYLRPCRHLESEGRTFPVEIAYRAEAPGTPGQPVWEKAAQHAVRLMRQRSSGDCLVFMPGAFEISRTLRALSTQPGAADFLTLPLHGDLPPDQQDAALEPDPRHRRILVATNVAETSITIPGVTLVVDSGLARIATHDHRRGIDTLLTERISRAAADQRAGRAGRTAPGYCLRLWSQRDHETRPAFETPEIQRLDLSELLLALLASGIDSPDTLPWLEAPDPARLERAWKHLADLGAIGRTSGKLTHVGRQLAALPLDPRLGRLLLAAREEGCLPEAQIAAGVAQGRPLLLPLDDPRKERERDSWLPPGERGQSDLCLEVAAVIRAEAERFSDGWCREWGVHRLAAREAWQAAAQFDSILGRFRTPALEQDVSGLCSDSPDTSPWQRLRRAILAAFSDRIAKRRDEATLRCHLLHGRGGEVRRQSEVRKAPLIVAAEMEERELRGEIVLLLGRNTAIEEAWLEDLFPQEIQEAAETRFDAREKRVVTRQVRLFRDLPLAERERDDPDLEEAARLLAAEVAAGRLELKRWNAKVEDWIARLNTVARLAPTLGFPALEAEDRSLLLEQFCHGATRYRELRDKDPWPVVRGYLSPEQATWLDSLTPERFSLPSGATVRIRYSDTDAPVLSAMVQQLYDLREHPSIAEGRIALKLEILAPNRRPVQITDDIAGFWANSYERVRKELKGRYPKHEWR